MAKGRIVTDSVRALIARTKEKHDKWTAQEVRNEVEYILRQQDETVPRGWPGLSVVQRTLADMKRASETPSPLDGRWHLGTLDNYPIAHAAIPMVLEVWKLRATKVRDAADLRALAAVDPMAYARAVPAVAFPDVVDSARKIRRRAAELRANDVDPDDRLLRDGLHPGLDKRLTIREAKWAARLCGRVEDTERLSVWAADYADAERLYESIGRPFFSGLLDAELMGLVKSAAHFLDRPVVHESLLPPAPKRTRKGGK